MFMQCPLENIDVSHFNTENVTVMGSMFSMCSNLKNVDLSHFNTSSVVASEEGFVSMFYGCSSLASLNLSSFTFTSFVKTTTMFGGCSSLQTLTIPATANHLSSSACYNVGSPTTPCTLVYPENFNLETDETGNGWYKWKSGYFKDGRQEAYAVLSTDETTLTFYYDTQRALRSGTTYDMNTRGNTPGWISKNGSITSVVFDPSFADARPTCCRYWFGLYNLNNITGLEYLNTSAVTDMVNMFIQCPLEHIDVSHFNTENVTSMTGMFSLCTNLKDIDLSSFDTSSVTDPNEGFVSMFYGCSSLTNLNLGSFTFNSSANTKTMLGSCSSLQSLTIPATANDLASDACLDVGSSTTPCTLVYPAGFNPVTDETGDGWYKWKGGYFKDAEPEPYAVFNGNTLTFYYDKQRANRTGTTYDLNTAYDEPGWFVDHNCFQTQTVVFDASFVDARPTSCESWFCGMTGLTSIVHLDYLNTSEVTRMSYMFGRCQNLTTLDVSSFVTDNVTSMSYMFYQCYNLTTLEGLSSFNTGNVASMVCMFMDCTSLTNLQGISFNTRNMINCDGMFANCSSLTTLNLINFTIPEVYNTGMFTGCTSLQSLILPATANRLAEGACDGVGTSDNPCTLLYPDNITLEGATTGDGWYKWKGGYFKDAEPEPYAVLNGTTLLFIYDKWRATAEDETFGMNTGNANPEWYSKAGTIESVLFTSSFADARPKSCARWFDGMSKITNIIGINYLNTSEVTTMYQMFSSCNNLGSLDLSGFNTAKVTNMEGMFYYCYKLSNLDVSSFTFNETVQSSDIFFSLTGLKELIISPTAGNLNSNACIGVGKQATPCTLIYPEGFNLVTDETGDGYYKWKGGYFKDAEPEPYTVLSTDETTLTFYYDNQRVLRAGTTYDLNDGESEPGWDQSCYDVTTVVFDSKFSDVRPTTCFMWFDGMLNLTTIEHLDCLNTSDVTNMKNMFSRCKNLTTLDVSSFVTDNVTSMAYMFDSCTNLRTLEGLSSFNTENVEAMIAMFQNCSSLTELEGVDGFNMDKVYDNGYMFKGCSKLKRLILDDFKIPYESSKMLSGCTSLQSLSINPIGANELSSDAFTGVGTAANPCALYTTVDITPDVSFDNYFKWKSGYFKDPVNEPYAVLSGTTLTFVYDKNKGITRGEIFGMNTGVVIPGWHFKASTIENVVFTSTFADARPTSCAYWFSGMSQANIINIQYLNTSEVTNMYYMFNSCNGLTRIDLSGFNTTNVTNMQNMFYGCSSLESLDVSGFNTEQATNMSGMFSGCSSLESIDVSGFNTARVTYMGEMFNKCSSLTSLDLSSFTMPSNMYWSTMLKNCTALKTLIVPATAGNMPANACSGVGTQDAPCTLVYPAGFTPMKDEEGDGWYKWKGGYFKDRSFPMGDVNHDGAVTITDVTLTVDYVLGKHPSPFFIENGDVSGDELITITDVTSLVNIILTQNASHAPATAREATFDRLWLTTDGSHCLLHLDTPESYTAMHLTLRLPEGGAMGNVRLSSSRSAGHHATMRPLGDGLYNVVLHANDNTELRSEDTALLHFDLAGCQPYEVEVVAVQSTNRLYETILSGGTATGIEVLEVSDDATGEGYNTVGVRVGKNARGVVIKNGSKMVRH